VLRSISQSEALKRRFKHLASSAAVERGNYAWDSVLIATLLLRSKQVLTSSRNSTYIRANILLY